MRNSRNTLCLLLVVSYMLIPNSTFGQFSKFFNNEKLSYSTVGIGGGSSHYLGDLAPYSYLYYSVYTNVRWNGTINYQRHFTPQVSGRASFTFARIYGNDATFGGTDAGQNGTNRLRNLHFRNDLMEFSVMGIYSFKPMDDKFELHKKLKWSPYIGVGIGIVGHNPMAKGSILDANSGTFSITTQPWESLRNKNNEVKSDDSYVTYSSIIPVFPIAVGVKAKLNENWILSLEGGARFTFFDYLDDVGGNRYSTDPMNEFSYRAGEAYDAVSGVSRTPIFREELTLRGLPTADVYPGGSAEAVIPKSSLRGASRKDMYLVTQITLNYIISNRVKCPPLKK